MQELNSQAQDLVDAGHFDPNAVEETRIVMEERFVIYCHLFNLVLFYYKMLSPWCSVSSMCFQDKMDVSPIYHSYSSKSTS